MKKYILCAIFIFCLFFLFKPISINKVSANETSNDEQIAIENITTSAEKQLENFDFGELESYYENENLLFNENNDLRSTLSVLITSDETISINDIFNLVLNGVKNEIGNILKLITLIIAIVGFGAFSEMLNSNKSSGVSNVVNFFLLTVILSIVTKIVADFIVDTSSILSKIKGLTEVLFPILLSLLITIGGVSSSATFQPAVVVLTGGVIEVIVILTTSISTICFIVSVLGEITDNIKLDKLKNFLSSAYKWTLGLIFTIFMGYLSISGILSGGADKISIKTAKYAIKSYIPLVGGYVSDSYEIFRTTSVLLKNSIGVVGVSLLFCVIIGRVITFILYNLGFKLASGLIEPMGASKISKFLASLSSIFSYLIAGIVTCFMLCFLSILIIMSSANTI